MFVDRGLIDIVVFYADIMEKHRAGKLVPLLTEAGAIANASAQL